MSSDHVKIILVDDNDIDTIVNRKLIEIAMITDMKNVISFSGHTPLIHYLDNELDNIKDHQVIVLMDIQMPEVDGFGCVEKILEYPKEKVKNFRVFMLTSSIDREDIERAKTIKPIERVLEKPLDVYMLKTLINE